MTILRFSGEDASEQAQAAIEATGKPVVSIFNDDNGDLVVILG